MSKCYCLRIEKRWFRKPLVVVQVMTRFPTSIPSSLAGEIYRYDTDVYDIPDIQERLDSIFKGETK